MTKHIIHELAYHSPEWGLIPAFLNPVQTSPAAEQFNEHYCMGWRPQERFSVVSREEGDYSVAYPGDPVMQGISSFDYGDEVIVLFPHGYVGVFGPNDAFEICRMD